MKTKEKNEEKEFSGMSIPDSVTDPDERELWEMINKIDKIAIKKGWSVMFLARIEEKGESISFFEGCPHCISIVLKNALDRGSREILDILLPAIAAHVAGTQSVNSKIASLAKKNTPMGN